MADSGSRRSGNNAQQLPDGQASARPKRERQQGCSRGPRSLFLRRCDNNGFGFTLRHFIVYPPESYTVLQGDQRLGLRHGNAGQGAGSAGLDEPMDTIFVKNVRENSSADVAGLATGDRIISVNGETVTGRTYAQVVQLIQKSGKFLHLLVVPKEDDILQLYFGETAHNPETNQRPSRVKSPETSAHHHRGTGQASMMRQQSPVPFSSLQPTSQQQQASSLPLPHHLHHHHRQQLTSQNQASSRPLLRNPPHLANLQAVKTATCPQTNRITMPSSVDSSNLWSPQSMPASGNENKEGITDRITFYHGTGGDDANGGVLSNFRSHVKGPSVRRNSDGNSPAMKRESAYGYAGSGRCGGDLRAVGGGNESNLYYSVPGNERRMSVDNSLWSRGSTSSAVYKLRQSEDIMGSAGGGLAYPNSEESRRLFYGQNLGPLAPLSVNSMASSSCGSTENLHLTAESVNSLQRLHYSGAAGCRLSLDGGSTRRDSSVSLPSNGLVRDNSTATEGSKDSLVSFDSASTLTGGGQDRCSSDDSVIMSRIRKSFEQKEEFLKRPNQPISWSISPGDQQQPSSPLISQHAVIAREFYARPQKFQRPLWPPQNPGSSSPILYRQQSPPRSSGSGSRSNYSSSSSNTSNKPTHQNLQRVKSDIDSERDSLSSRSSGEERPCHQQSLSDPWDDNQSSIRGEFIYGGPVSNVPTTVLSKSAFSQQHASPQFRPITPVLPSASTVTGNSSNGSTASVRHGSGGKPSFISTLTRIHENIPVSDPGSSVETYTSMINDATEEVFDASRGSSSLPSSLPSSPAMGVATADPGAQHPRSLLTPSEGTSNQNPSHIHPMLQLVSRRARQFETGRLDDEEGLPSDRTSLYRSELSRLSSKRSVPNVAVRKREFESRSTSGNASGGSKDGRRMNRESRSLENAAVTQLQKYGTTGSSSLLSGNRLIPIGGKQLHCEPPAEFCQQRTDSPSSENQDETSEPVKLRVRSNSADSWAVAMGSVSWQGAGHGALEWRPDKEDDRGDGAKEPQRHKAVRQDSYLAAVRAPVTAEHMAKLLKRQGALPMDEHEEMDGLTPPVPYPERAAVRPTQLPIISPLRPAESQPVTSSPTCGLADEATTEARDGIGTFVAALNGVSPVPVSAIPSDSSNVVSAATTDISSVVRRQKNPTVSEEERVVRRVSYLKATWGDRMHVDSDLDLSDTESPHVQLRSAHRRWRPPLFPDDIQRLKRIFEDAAASSPHPTPAHARQRQRSIIGTEPSTAESLQPESNKENLLREGWLHCKITLVDGKRAGDRSWKQVWAVLRGPILYLCKDRRDSHQQQHQTPLNVSDTISEQQSTSSAVDVRCSQVDIADNYTKKKHVLRLNALGGSELLLQADDADNMVQWLHALQAQANEKEDCVTSGSSKQQQQSAQSAGAVSGGANSRLSPLPTNKGIRKLTSFRNRSPTGQSPVNKTRKPSQTDQIPSPKTKTWKGRVARQLRRIQQGSGSPSSPTAPHPEGVTIGVPLEDCPQSTFSEFVPLLVELCTNIVELRGLDITGIYRVPGNTAVLSSLTEEVNKRFDSISLQDSRWHDVNVVSSLLKLFFRRLPDSLLTSELYPHFIEADKIEDPVKRIVAIKKLLHELPDHHFETLKFLLLHLKKVVEHSTANKMEARNLAIIFGPTLVRTADDNMVTMVTDMAHQCQIIELLISHVDWFFSDDESEDFSNFPFSLPHDSTEPESASSNHNLLLSNIQKVEGMKADSPNKDISAKDIVSSIISAANRKMQKAKSRKGGRGTGSGATVEDGRETPGEVKENADTKQPTSESKSTKRKESMSAVESDDTPASNVASSIFESVLFSGNIVKSIHTGEEEESAAARSEATAVPNHTSAHEESGGGEAQAGGRSNKVESLGNAEEHHQVLKRGGGIIAGSDEVPIRTYAGLSALTQERIRRFERETKAMLQRDLTRQRSETEWREAERKRIEMELQQAKHDMESEDLLDRIADNPSDITKRITDMSNVVQRDKKGTVGDNSKCASTIGRRFSSSSLLSSSTNSNSVTSSNSELPRSPFLTSHSNWISSRDEGNNQTKFESSQSPVDRDQSSSLQQFTRTKKVGTTHIFPDNPRSLGGIRNGSVDGSSSSSTDVVSVPSSSTLLPGKPNTESASTELDGGGLLPQSPVAVTLPPSSGSSQHVLRRGNSAENLHASVQQRAQKGTSAPNGILNKKLKTGKEQLELATPLLSPRPPSPLIGSLRCGSLDSLQEAYSSERPQSDISDEGSDLLASLTSTFDRKLKSLLSTTATAEAVTDATTVTETTQEFSKLPQEKGTADNYDAKSLPVSVGESADTPESTPESSQLGTSAVKFSNVEKISVQPAAVFTPTCTALFRDPSLHRRASTSVDHQGQKDEATGKDEEQMEMETKKQDDIVQGRSRESGSVSDRSNYPHGDQKSSCRGKNCEKRGEDDEACSGSLKTVPKEVTAVARPKSIDSVTKTEKMETSHNAGLGRSESQTKSEKEGGSAANMKLKRSGSLTKADKHGMSAVNTRLKRSESLTKAEKSGDSTLSSTKLKRSESLTKAEKTETSSNTRLRRSESLTKTERSESPSNTKLKRSDSLTKTEKTESNISKRRQQEMLISGSCIRSSSRGNKEKENIATILTKFKRKNGMPERSIKRRHTVGGTKDFDKVHWLDNRLQHEQLAENEAADAVALTTMNNKERHCLRTSSPDLSSSRLSGVLARDGFLVEISLLGSGGIMAELRQQLLPIAGRPHSLPDPNLASRVFKVPLESHV